MKTSTLALVAMLAATAAPGCASVEATYPKCPVPVLLSRVDRVGGKAPARVATSGSLDVLAAHAGHEASASGDGNGNSSGSRSEAGAMTLTLEVLAMVPTARDASVSDIRLERVRASTFLVNMVAGFVESVNVTPAGRKVRNAEAAQ